MTQCNLETVSCRNSVEEVSAVIKQLRARFMLVHESLDRIDSTHVRSHQRRPAVGKGHLQSATLVRKASPHGLRKQTAPSLGYHALHTYTSAQREDPR